MPSATVPPVLKDAKNKPEFNFDCLTQIEGVDPLTPLYADFDWQLLSELLGEPTEPEDLKAAMQDADRAKLAKVVTEIFLLWLLENHQLRRLDFVGRRVVALAWVLNPGLFQGESLRGLAKKAKVDRTALTDLTGDVGRKWGLRNRAQSHAGNFKPAQP